MPLTPEDVVNKRFQPTKFREGYDQDEVDDFLDEIVVELRRLNGENDDLRQRLLFYQEHVFPSPGAEDAVARLLAENARQQAELLELRRKLAVYHEFCVCFDECC